MERQNCRRLWKRREPRHIPVNLRPQSRRNSLLLAKFRNNPLFQITLQDYSDDNELFIDLKAPKEYNVGFEVWQISSFRNKSFEKCNSGPFRYNFNII